MSTSPSVFDNAVDKWIDSNNMPWGRLKTDLTRSNLKRHLSSQPLRILDAGGGTGADSIPLAQEGHVVDLVDYSQAMLAAAERDATHAGVSQCVRLHQADVMQIPPLFSTPQFDVVLCHNVLQYVDDVPALLRALVEPLKPDGIVSLISTNRFAIPWRAAFFRNDLDEAYQVLDARSEMTMLFGHPAAEYSGDEVQAMLPQTALAFDAYYGIRCVTDYWGDNERKLQPEIWAKIVRLEFALTGRYPYNLLARFWQIIAHKQ